MTTSNYSFTLIATTAGSARVVKGECLDKAAIQALKDSGDYHNLFSKGAVIVPEHVKKASALRLSIANWADTIIDACFHPPATEGADRHSKANPWWCICATEWPKGAGNPWHEPLCPRRRWTEGSLDRAPTIGERVTHMLGFGRAARRARFRVPQGRQGRLDTSRVGSLSFLI